MAANKSTKANNKSQAETIAKNMTEEQVQFAEPAPFSENGVEEQVQLTEPELPSESSAEEESQPAKPTPSPEESAATRPPVVKEIDLHQTVVVRNGFQGTLVYQSTRTGETFIWREFGDEQDMELGELRNARNSHKNFFINNWFMFDEPWVIDYLGMAQYYKLAISIDDLDNIFLLPPDELEVAISALPDGQKSSVAYRASNLIADGTIDSNKTITTLENVLGVNLVERG